MLNDRAQFIQKMNHVLRSAEPIDSTEHLKGRSKAIQRIEDALSSPGKHVFIHGFRGVGKTSLAITSAYKTAASARPPVIVNCDHTSSFLSVAEATIRTAVEYDPLTSPLSWKGSVGFDIKALKGSVSAEQKAISGAVSIKSLSEYIEYLKSISSINGPATYIVIDEFDKLNNHECHQSFASLIKTISDQRINVKFVFCGVADDIDKLFQAHESIARQIHAEPVDRLELQARLDIISDAEAALEISIPQGFKYRIALISDGFPSFVHLMCEKIFLAKYDTLSLDQIQSNEKHIADELVYDQGIKLAVQQASYFLMRDYRNALYKNGRSYELVIWSIAGDDLLELNIDDAWRNYLRICDQLGNSSTSRPNFATKLNQLASDQRGHLLRKPRRSNYTFSEQMMRGYARLCAQEAGIILGPENPSIGRQL